MSGQRRRLLADEENAEVHMPVGIHCGEGDERVKEKKGPLKAGGTLTACCRHFSNTHQNG